MLSRRVQIALSSACHTSKCLELKKKKKVDILHMFYAPVVVDFLGIFLTTYACLRAFDGRLVQLVLSMHAS